MKRKKAVRLSVILLLLAALLIGGYVYNDNKVSGLNISGDYFLYDFTSNAADYEFEDKSLLEAAFPLDTEFPDSCSVTVEKLEKDVYRVTSGNETLDGMVLRRTNKGATFLEGLKHCFFLFGYVDADYHIEFTVETADGKTTDIPVMFHWSNSFEYKFVEKALYIGYLWFEENFRGEF